MAVVVVGKGIVGVGCRIVEVVGGIAGVEKTLP